MDGTQDILFIILHFVNTLSGHNCYYTEIVKLHLLVPSCPVDRCHVIGESYLVVVRPESIWKWRVKKQEQLWSSKEKNKDEISQNTRIGI